jgi:hypothetical protein
MVPGSGGQPSQSRFVNLSELLGLNAAAGQRMAKDVSNRIVHQGQNVERAVDEGMWDWRGQLRHTDEGSRGLEEVMGTDNFQRLTNQANDVSAMADATRTQEGRDALIGHFNQGTTAGGRRLDAALLGSREGNQELGRARQYSGIRDLLGNSAQHARTVQGQHDQEINSLRAQEAAERQRQAQAEAERQRQLAEQQRERQREWSQHRQDQQNRRETGWTREDSDEFYERRRNRGGRET